MAEQNVTIGIKFTVDGKSIEGAATIAGDQIKKLGAALGGSAGQAKEMDGVAKLLNDRFKGLGSTIEEYLIGKLKALGVAFTAMELLEKIEEATRLAAVYQKMGLVLETIGKTAGYTAEQLEATNKTLEEHDLTMNQAREAAVRLVRAHIDLGNAAALSNAAENAAAAAGISTADALSRITFAAQTGATRMLRHIGLVVDATTAYKSFATANHTFVAELTDTQRAQAVANAIIEKAASLQGAHAAALQTVAKAMDQLKDTTEDVKTLFGSLFTTALLTIVQGLSSAAGNMKSTLQALAADGTLQRWGDNIAITFAVVADAVDVVRVVLLTVLDTIATFVQRFTVAMAAATDAERAVLSGHVDKVKGIYKAWKETDDDLLNNFKKNAEDRLAGIGRFQRKFEEIQNKREEDKKAHIQAEAEKELATRNAMASVMQQYGMGLLSLGAYLKALQDIAKAQAEGATKPGDGSEARVAMAKAQGDAAIANAQAASRFDIFKQELANEDSAYKLAQAERTMTDREYLQRKTEMSKQEIEQQMQVIRAQIAGEAALNALDSSKAHIANIVKLQGTLDALGLKYTEVTNNAKAQLDKLADAEKRAGIEAAQAIAAAQNAASTKTIEAAHAVGATDDVAYTRQKYEAQLSLNNAELQSLTQQRELTAAGAERIKIDGQIVAKKIERKALEEESAREDIKAIASLYTQNVELGAQNKALGQQIAFYGMSDSYIARVTARHLEEALALLKAKAATTGMTDELRTQIKYTEDAIAAQKKFAVQTDTLDRLKNPFKAIQQSLQDLSNGFKQAGDAANAFGANFGQGFQGVASALDTYSQSLSSIEAARVAEATESSKYWKDEEDSAKGMADINEKYAKQSAAASIKMYADILGSAKTFFKEGSEGYKILSAAEKAFRAIELAEAIATTAKKIALTFGWLAADTTAKTTAAATDEALTFKAVALAIIRTTWGVISGAAQMFGQSGWGGFVGVALMLGLLAALGWRSSGGGSSVPGGAMSAADRQAQNGTGTVLGDVSAKSDSINNVIKAMKDNSDQELIYENSMSQSLISIDSAMQSLARAVAKTFGVVSPTSTIFPNQNLGTHLNVPADPLLFFGGNQVSSFLFGSSSRSLLDSGLFIPQQSVGSARSNFQGSYYEDIQTTRRGPLGGLFGGNSTSTSRDTSPLNAQDARNFQLFIGGVADSITQAVGLLSGKAGPDLDAFLTDVGNFVNGLNLPDLSISLQGLKGQDLVDALEHAFSSMSDTLAQQVIEHFAPGVAEFAHVGEGMFETLIRVATGVEHGTQILRQFNVQAINYNDIINKQGDVATELVRQSLMNTEHLVTGGVDALSGVGQILQNFQGSADDLAALYQKLLDIRTAMRAVGSDADYLDQNMIQAAGGISKFLDGLKTYSENFFTTGEQWRAAGNELRTSFQRLGVTMPTSREGFRHLIESLDLTTDSGRTLYGQLIALAPAFNQVVGAIDDIKKSITDMFDSTRRNILLATMTKQQQYDFYQKEADTLYARALASNDPAEVQRLTGQIIDDINNAFGSLTPEQQQQLGPQFLAHLTTVQTNLTDHLDKLPDTLTAVTTTLTTVSTTLTDTATTNQTAANTQLQAANTQQNAAQINANGVNVNVKIAVRDDRVTASAVSDGG